MELWSRSHQVVSILNSNLSFIFVSKEKLMGGGRKSMSPIRAQGRSSPTAGIGGRKSPG